MLAGALHRLSRISPVAQWSEHPVHPTSVRRGENRQAGPRFESWQGNVPEVAGSNPVGATRPVAQDGSALDRHPSPTWVDGV